MLNAHLHVHSCFIATGQVGGLAAVEMGLDLTIIPANQVFNLDLVAI